ncbi:hypothetical protein BDZ91DRAFT_722153 [Kalaharituber pfeilii]|nr:hypothetical protein BDZ91DRAFT_722153 [Kalaharituber pfeilii]
MSMMLQLSLLPCCANAGMWDVFAMLRECCHVVELSDCRVSSLASYGGVKLSSCRIPFLLWTVISVIQSFYCQVVCCFAIPLLQW